MIDISTQQPTLKLQPRPNDLNANGSIFGGWLLENVDIAGGIASMEVAKGPTATVAIKDLTFLKPIFVYDLVSIFTKVVNVGKTSITVKVEVYATRFTNPSEVIKISDATLVFVAINKPGEKRIM